MEFVDRILKCFDCGEDFVFTAGEQLFFFDRQFKNDPKRCKLCKAKRAGLGRVVVAAGGEAPAVAALPLSRTETRTECSACGVETTVPFKPTQGRPVFCRSCFQLKRVPAAAVAKGAGLTEPDLMPIPTDGLASAETMEAIAQSPSLLLEGAESSRGISPELLAEAASA